MMGPTFMCGGCRGKPDETRLRDGDVKIEIKKGLKDWFRYDTQNMGAHIWRVGDEGSAMEVRRRHVRYEMVG